MEIKCPWNHQVIIPLPPIASNSAPWIPNKYRRKFSCCTHFPWLFSSRILAREILHFCCFNSQKSLLSWCYRYAPRNGRGVGENGVALCHTGFPADSAPTRHMTGVLYITHDGNDLGIWTCFYHMKIVRYWCSTCLRRICSMVFDGFHVLILFNDFQ